MFAYYSKWIGNVSARSSPFLRAELRVFHKAQERPSAKASLGAIRDDLAFEVESGASVYAITAILSQGRRHLCHAL